MRLPASSIYWHFKDRDDLLAAVIQRSFGSWLSAWAMSADGDAVERATAVATQIAKALLDSPDFIRLGLTLVLERRPVEPRARAMFLRVREQVHAQLQDSVSQLAPELTSADARQLATYALMS